MSVVFPLGFIALPEKYDDLFYISLKHNKKPLLFSQLKKCVARHILRGFRMDDNTPVEIGLQMTFLLYDCLTTFHSSHSCYRTQACFSGCLHAKVYIKDVRNVHLGIFMSVFFLVLFIILARN